MTWDEAVAHALTLPGAELSTSYGQPAVKANGNTFLNVGHEADTSFCLHLDRGLVDMLMETHPDTFFQTPHYHGYPALLVRHDTADDELVRDMIARGCERARAKKAPRRR